MRISIATAAAAGAAFTRAQGYGPASSASSASTTAWPTSTYYEYYDDCTTVSSGQATITGTIVSTASPTSGGVLTTYTTAYKEFCSSGSAPFTMKTYTITEPCTNPGVPHSSDHVPSAFTVTTATCHVCASTPVVGTITTPNPTPARYAPSAGIAPAPYSPVGTGSPGSPGAGAPGAGSPGSGSPGTGSGGAGVPPAPGAGSPGSYGSPAPGAGTPPAPGAGSPGSYGSPAPGAGTPPAPGAESPGSYGSPAAPAGPGGKGPAGSYGCPSGGCSNSTIASFTGTASTMRASHLLMAIVPLLVGAFALGL